ncbi:MTR4 [Hepatospora eriocheir]|uniref:MTR4 n=1 Tax=Hepatospora eriocheir TaxID=1081669 RepID=A0A1X0QE41_9MICR|nr:MTR4 [Hepatospora eriocheir]
MNEDIDNLFDSEILENETKLNIVNKVDEQVKTCIYDEFVLNNTKHEVITPITLKNYKTIPREPKVTAKEYKFALDTFQALAISAIENDRSVLVSAHTSCGKTVVAEYAIAQSINDKQRVIYTSPIKALSNQKFRELQEEFGDVGLMTGDVTLNPDATCLVMTTEILRNMLYKGSELTREIHWIIFDEIHYLKDKERGVVWEETLILAPKHARMIFLSATIPNAREFGEWIATICEQIVHIIYTEKRVIPLVHYFYSADDQLREIKSISGKFNSDEFMASQNKTIFKKHIAKCINSLLEMINVPCVIFVFIRKRVEELAFLIEKDFLNEEEKSAVRTIFHNAISSLNEADRNLKGIQMYLPLFERGIGVHHSGLLPIIKEISELLFQESLIKVLFATETFSIGLNMPAKTVVFATLKKFDGKNERILTSGEYTQMSGRAGRRGLDEEGTVISLVTDNLASKSIVEMLNKGSDKLTSSFRLTYNMILNLMRVEELDPLYMLSRSFYHFQAYKNCLEIQESLEEPLNESSYTPEMLNLNSLLKKREELISLRCKEISQTLDDYIKMNHRVVDITIPRNGVPLIIRNCIVKEFIQRDDADYVNLFIEVGDDIENREFPVDYISAVYDFRAKVEKKMFNRDFSLITFNSNQDSKIEEIDKKIVNLLRRSGIKVNSVNDIFKKCLICNNETKNCLLLNSSTKVCNLSEFIYEYTQCIDKVKQKDKLNNIVSLNIFELKKQIYENKLNRLEELKEVYHMEECKKMINVLRKLGHLDGNICTLKGKMASEISSADEVLLTEVIFSSNFNELSLIDMIALLSIPITERCREAEDYPVSQENQILIDTIFHPCIK